MGRIEVPETQRTAVEAAGRGEDFRCEYLLTVAHTLRSVLAAIEGNLLVLRSAISDESPEAEVLGDIQGDAQALSALADQFVEFAELEDRASRESPAFEPTPPRDLVRKAAGVLGEIARARRILISDRLPEGLPAVAARRERLRRALTHVLSSAIEFSPRGGVVTLEARSQDGTVSLDFSLEGQGVPAPGPGGAAGSKRSGTRPGAGLGLLLAREVLREHGGRLEVSGTRLSAVLPCAAAPAAAPGPGRALGRDAEGER